MKIRIGPEDERAQGKLPSVKPDASGIGVNYADAYLKAFKTTLDDGRKVTCTRRGLMVTFKIGDRKGEGLMRRIEHGPDVKDILQHALQEAALDGGWELSTKDGEIFVDLKEN